MVRIAADENLHMVFYRDILGAALKLQPSAAVRAIVDEVLAFEMPGAGIPGFMRKAAQIAKAGIYDLRVHRDEVLLPILKHWGIFELTGLDAAAEAARERLAEHLASLDEAAKRFEERLAAKDVVRGDLDRADRRPHDAWPPRRRRIRVAGILGDDDRGAGRDHDARRRRLPRASAASRKFTLPDHHHEEEAGRRSRRSSTVPRSAGAGAVAPVPPSPLDRARYRPSSGTGRSATRPPARRATAGRWRSSSSTSPSMPRRPGPTGSPSA